MVVLKVSALAFDPMNLADLKQRLQMLEEGVESGIEAIAIQVVDDYVTQLYVPAERADEAKQLFEGGTEATWKRKDYRQCREALSLIGANL